MNLTDYHAKYFAYELTKRCSADSMEKLAGAVAGAQVDLNPHQVDAALFAFNSPLSKGALLADEVGLGKTIEAGLVLAQKWAERKLEGFTYAPSDSVYWQHGKSTERDFLYVTTATLTHDQRQQLSDEVGADRTLLVVCSAFRGRKEGYPNLTVKKIPKAVLSRCEWGKDGYSLKVENLPKAPPPPPAPAPKTDKAGQQSLFAEEDGA
ncbi:MAG TPA: hypothetical protein VK477_08565 [Acidobacteriota bacterium]|nr:hypothetical protein [Acidobacteriota bacterium]